MLRRKYLHQLKARGELASGWELIKKKKKKNNDVWSSDCTTDGT